MTSPRLPVPASDLAFLGPFERFLVSLLPDAYRDDIAGDLIEEASAIERGPNAPLPNRWIRRQLLISMPAIMSLHFRQKENDEMKHAKWMAAAALLGIAALQAWDSGILNAPPAIGALVAIAIAIGIAGLFVEHEGIRFGIAVLVFVMLFAARMLSPVRLPELTLIGLPVFLLLVLGSRFMAMAKQKRGPGGPQAPA